MTGDCELQEGKTDPTLFVSLMFGIVNDTYD